MAADGFVPMRRLGVRVEASTSVSDIDTGLLQPPSQPLCPARENTCSSARKRNSVSRVTENGGFFEVAIDEVHSDSEASMDEGEFLFNEHADDMGRRSSNRKEMLGQMWSHSTYCRSLVTSVVFLNTLVIAAEAMYINDRLKVFDAFEVCFTLFYVGEICFRLHETGVLAFLTQMDWAWNIFDIVITFFSVVDTVTTFTSGSASGAAVGRLFRIFRILRMFRAMRFLHEVDFVIGIAAKATMKLGLIVSLFIFVSAILATNICWDSQDELVSASFGNLGVSAWTMFKLMTLDDWVPISERVIAEKPGMVMFFVFFIFSTSIALFSLVPAIFIEISLNYPKFEAEKEKEALRKRKIKLLRTLFKLTDSNSDGNISIHELKKVLTDDGVLHQLQKTGLSGLNELRDVRLGLFDLWEEQLVEAEEMRSEISEEDFISGLLRSASEVSQGILWRNTMATRLAVRDLTNTIHKELSDIQTNQKHYMSMQDPRDLDNVLSAIHTSIEAFRHDLEKLSPLNRQAEGPKPFSRQSCGDACLSSSDVSEVEGNAAENITGATSLPSVETINVGPAKKQDPALNVISSDVHPAFQRCGDALMLVEEADAGPVALCGGYGLALSAGIEGRFTNALLQMSPRTSPRSNSSRTSSEKRNQDSASREGSRHRGRSNPVTKQLGRPHGDADERSFGSAVADFKSAERTGLHQRLPLDRDDSAKLPLRNCFQRDEHRRRRGADDADTFATQGTTRIQHPEKDATSFPVVVERSGQEPCNPKACVTPLPDLL